MYRKVVVRRTPEQQAARERMRRGGHELVLLAQGERSTREVGAIASKVEHLWENLRTKERCIYGGLLRFIDISAALGTPKAVLKTIPGMIDWYIEDRYGPTDTAEIRLVA